MKKILFSLFFIVVSLFVFSFVNVKATGSVVMEDGASIRRIDPVGLKFTAQATGFSGENVTYGFILSKGNFDKTTLLSKSADKIKVVDCEGTDENGYFHVTVTNVPENGYTKQITALAFVDVDGNKTYADSTIVRNIGETACIAKQNGYSSDLINSVYEYVTTHFMVKTVTSTNEFVISNVLTKKYSYNKRAELWQEFINDYNAATGASLTTDSTQEQFYNSFSNNIGGGSVSTIPANNNAVKFFSGTNMVKWGWILEFFQEYGNSIHVRNQADALLRIDRTCQQQNGFSNRLMHLSYSIYNLMTGGTAQGGDSNVQQFGSESSYNNVSWPNVTNFNSANVIAVNTNVNLPSADRDYYTLDNYILNGSELDTHNVNESISVTIDEKVFTPSYSPIVYSITYHYGDGTNSVNNPSVYDYESQAINLEAASKANYVFAGWYYYDNFEGDEVISIPKGSHGNIDLYAKFIREVSYVNSAWAGTTPGDPVPYDNHNYTFGTDAFATITDALAAASEYEQIYVLAGTYNETFTISTNGVSLIGPNNNISGSSNSRNDEAVLTEVITLGAGLVNSSILGFNFTGSSRLICSTNVPSANLEANLNGFNFEYNKVNSSINDAEVKGFIYFNTGFGNSKYAYNYNLVFNDNYFTTSNDYNTYDADQREGEKDYDRLIFLYDVANLTLTNNEFNSVKGDCIYVDDHGLGQAGSLIVRNNTFSSLYRYAINIDWIACMTANTYDISITHNRFLSETGSSAYINFEDTNDALVYKSFEIESNIFKGNTRILWFDAKATVKVGNNNELPTFSYNYIEILDAMRYICKSDYTSGQNRINCSNNLYVNASSNTVNANPSSSYFNDTIVSSYSTIYINESTISDFNTASGLHISLSN